MFNIVKPNTISKVKDMQESTSAAAKESAKESDNFESMMIDTDLKTSKSRASHLLRHVKLNLYIYVGARRENLYWTTATPLHP